MKVVTEIEKFLQAFCSFVPFDVDVINITEPRQGFVWYIRKDALFETPHENVGKRRCHFGSHTGTVNLQVVLVVEYKIVVFKH